MTLHNSISTFAHSLEDLDQHLQSGDLTNSSEIIRCAITAVETLITTQDCSELILSYGDALQERAQSYSQPWLLEQAIAIYGIGIAQLDKSAAPDLFRRLSTHQANSQQRLGIIQGDADLLRASANTYTAVLETYGISEAVLDQAMILTNRASSFQALSGLAVEKNYLDDAIEDFSKACGLIAKDAAPDRWLMATLGLAQAFRVRGLRLSATNDFKISIDLYSEALTLPTIADKPSEHAMALNGLGVSRFRLGELQGDTDLMLQAIIAHKDAAAIYEKFGPTIDLAKALLNHGNISVRLAEHRGSPEDYETAIDSYQSAEQLIDRSIYPMDWTTAQTGLGNAYIRFGEMIGDISKIKSGRVYLLAAATVFSVDRTPADWAMSEINIGIVEQMLGGMTCSTELGQQAVERFSAVLAALGDSIPMAERVRIIGAKGMAEKSLGDLLNEPKYYLSAINAYQEVLGNINREENRSEYLRILSNLGNAFSSYGELVLDPNSLQEAVKTFDLSLAVDTDKERIGWATTQYNKGIVLANLGELLADRKYLEQAFNAHSAALEFLNKEEHLMHWLSVKNSMGSALVRYGRLFCDDKTLMKGIEHMRETVDFFANSTNIFLENAIIVNLSSALEDVYDYNCERKFLHEAYQLCRKSASSFSLEATPLYYLGMTKQLGSLLIKMGKSNEALVLLSPLLTDAIDIFSAEPERRRTDFLMRRISGLADMIAACLVSQGDYAEAIRVINSGRAMSLAQALNDRSRNTELTEAACVWRREQQILDGLMKLPLPENPAAQQQYYDHQHKSHLQVEQCYKNLVALRQKSGLETSKEDHLEALRHALPEGGCYVTPTVSDIGGALLIVQKENSEIGVVELPQFTSKRLRGLLGDRTMISSSRAGATSWSSSYQRYKSDLQKNHGVLSDEIALSWQQDLSSILTELSELMVSQLHKALKAMGLTEGADIVIAPPGALAVLPIPACPVDPEGQGLMMDHWAISYTPNMATYINARKRRIARLNKVASLCSVINPTDDLDLNVSPARNAYADNINHIELIGTQATADRVKFALKRATDFCFYCHGQWSTSDPLYSHLELSAGDVLSVTDIRGADTSNARIAFLGACETGIIDLRNAPDEFAGLPASFVEAGFPTVVSPLWPVPATTTSALTKSFFRHYQTNGSPASALRQAQLEMRRRRETDSRFSDKSTLGFRRKKTKEGDEGTFDNANLTWAAFVSYGA